MCFNVQPLSQSSRRRWENPRGSYEAPVALGRPSRLDRGSSTTKICQAVSTRESQTDSPSFIAVAALSQRLARAPPETSQENNLADTIDRSQHISSLLKKSQVSARQGENGRKNAVYTSVHEAFEAVFDAVSRCLRIFQHAASR